MLTLKRTGAIIASMLVAYVAAQLGSDVFLADGLDIIDIVRITLLAATSGWIAWGSSLAIGGLFAPAHPLVATRPVRDGVLTAVLVPVYNEEPSKTFSHVAAMSRSVEKAGLSSRFEFSVLSDTTRDDVGEAELVWFQRLRDTVPAGPALYYRRRPRNIGRKAGNIAEFIRTAGARYDYLIILDADSLMEASTFQAMVERMEADEKLGLLQTLPKIVHARSWFGRAIQFSSFFFSPVFARGLGLLQGREGPFWGHNAIVRTRAFAESCGLPDLPGKPPFGGHVLSHDYVEAALLARAGWTVRVDPDLEGSYEEGPDNVIDFAKRDRRWCQGNLQHSRIISAPGLKPWSRFTFAQGIMAYVASPLWLVFLVASILAPALAPEPDYFPVPRFPAVFPRAETLQAITLLGGVIALLIGPKLLIALRSVLTGEADRFGGAARVTSSTLVEVVWSSILAPVTLMFQSRSVWQVLSGADSGWPSADREAEAVGMREAWASAWWIVLTGVLLLAGTALLAPELFYWFVPIALPLTVAPWLISASSRPSGGAWAGRRGLFRTPAETELPDVVRMQEAVLAAWRGAPLPVAEAMAMPEAGAAARPATEH
ncbi:MAG: glucans biosynthesis glucosyltransferase MdoH [Notoacmeibacter sp.]|nr:glucans biosynthesis glucosyltransferase MdoH [Notoacmeibacter sp.]